MSPRSLSPFVLALGIAALLAVAGCEDDVVVDDGIPSDQEFIDATQGVLVLHQAALDVNLQRLRSNGDRSTFGSLQRRLRRLVPRAVADSVQAGETVSADYDSVAGEWVLTASATSGDSVDYRYDARLVYVDTTETRVPDFTRGLVLRGVLEEEISLRFRTGDFDSLASYEIDMTTSMRVDIEFDDVTIAEGDTFNVRLDGMVRGRQKAVGDTSVVDAFGIDATMRGPVGPRLAAGGSNCYEIIEQAEVDDPDMQVNWGDLVATYTFRQDGTTIQWFDPADTIVGTQRFRFAQSRLPVSCAQ